MKSEPVKAPATASIAPPADLARNTTSVQTPGRCSSGNTARTNMNFQKKKEGGSQFGHDEAAQSVASAKSVVELFVGR